MSDLSTTMFYMQNGLFQNMQNTGHNDYSELFDDLFLNNDDCGCKHRKNTNPDLNGDGQVSPFEACKWLTNQLNKTYGKSADWDKKHQSCDSHDSDSHENMDNWENDWSPENGTSNMLKYLLCQMALMTGLSQIFNKRHRKHKNCHHQWPMFQQEAMQPRNILGISAKIAARRPGFIESYNPMSIIAKTFQNSWAWK